MSRAAAALGLVLLAGCLEASRGAEGDVDVDAGGGGGGDGDAGGADATGVVAPGLVLRYRMDEAASGGIVLDDVGGHDATCDPCPTVAGGTIDGAFEFEGEYLSVQDSDALRTPEGSLVMWASLDDAVDGVFVSRPIGSELQDEIILFIENGVVKFQAGDGEALMTDALVLEGSWVHLAATWSSERNAIYLGGLMHAADETPPSFEYESVELLIGADRDDGAIANPIDALLDDLRIYDRALGEDEVAALAQKM